jgi:AraC family transcriptional regulator
VLADRALRELLAEVIANLEGDVSLEALAARAGLSPHHLHRSFRRLVGETPKQYTQRLRLEWAAAELACTERSVLEVALAAGFASHEVFTRAFRRHFGRPPARYRSEALAGASPESRRVHAEVVAGAGPCIGLFRMPANQTTRRDTMTTEVTRKETTEQPVLFIRSRVALHEIATALGECLPRVFGHCQAQGLAMAGPPFVRYTDMSAGMVTMEAGMPLAEAAAGEGDIEAGTLPGGVAAMAVHAGPYEGMPKTHAAIERWIEANGARVGGAPWESYITDPGETPDPADWRTEVYWPLA